MTILSYKGYQGSIEYEDGQLIIQLLHIDDFISSTCESATQVEAAFHELVDDYLVTCEESSRPPDKPYKGSLNIRMSPELHRRAAMAAAAAGISLNAWIVRACEAAALPPSKVVTLASKNQSGQYVDGKGSDDARSNDRIVLRKSNVVEFPKEKVEQEAGRLRRTTTGATL